MLIAATVALGTWVQNVHYGNGWIPSGEFYPTSSGKHTLQVKAPTQGRIDATFEQLGMSVLARAQAINGACDTDHVSQVDTQWRCQLFSEVFDWQSGVGKACVFTSELSGCCSPGMPTGPEGE